MGCPWQARWQADKRALRCEAWSPEGMLLLRIHSCGQSLPREGPNLEDRTGRCVCMSQLHSGTLEPQVAQNRDSSSSHASTYVFPPSSADCTALSPASEHLSLAIYISLVGRAQVRPHKIPDTDCFWPPRLLTSTDFCKSTRSYGHSMIKTQNSVACGWEGGALQKAGQPSRGSMAKGQ